MQTAFETQLKELRQKVTDVSPGPRAFWIEPDLLEPLQKYAIDVLKTGQVYRMTPGQPWDKTPDNATVIVIARNTESDVIAQCMKEFRAKRKNQISLVSLPYLIESSRDLLNDLKTSAYFSDELLDLQFFPTYDQNVFELRLKPQQLKAPMMIANLMARIVHKITESQAVELYTAKGMQGVNCLKIIERLQREDPKSATCVYNHVILLDRTVDVLSPLLQAQSYAEQLAHHVGFANNLIEKEYLYAATDDVLATVMHRHFNSIGEELVRLGDQLRASKQDIDDNSKKQGLAASALKALMLKGQAFNLKQDLVEKHTKLAKTIRMDKRVYQYTEQYLVKRDMILSGKFKFEAFIQMLFGGAYRLEEAIQLVVVYSIFVGLKAKEIPQLRKAVVQLFGVQGELALYAFQDVVANPKQLTDLLKALGCLEQDDKNTAAEKTSAAYGFYTPISVRVVENLLQENKQKKADGIQTESTKTGFNTDSNKTLVIVLGAMTHGEAAGFEALRKQGQNIEVLCTNLVDGLTATRWMYE